MTDSRPLYEVTGFLPYLGHQPGETFQATLDPAAEARALERGNIRIIRRGERPRIQPGSWTLPEGWQRRS